MNDSEFTKTPAPKKKTRKRITIPWRKNVLLLVGIGYFAVIIIFASMAWGSMTAENAYEIVKGPLMALIGGSLALSKDLVDNASGDSENTSNNNDN